MGAATEASKEGIPGIAFSGSTKYQTAWTAPALNYVVVYADLSTIVTQTLVASGKPYLPKSTWLNVDFPPVGTRSCSSPAGFKFILTRIDTAVLAAPADVKMCGSTRLPTETAIVNTDDCYVGISVGEAMIKTDATELFRLQC